MFFFLTRLAAPKRLCSIAGRQPDLCLAHGPQPSTQDPWWIFGVDLFEAEPTNNFLGKIRSTHSNQKKTSRGSQTPKRSQENFGTNCFVESLKFFGLLSRVRKLCSASHCTCNRKAKTPSQELKRDAATCCRAPLSVKGSACTLYARGELLHLIHEGQ